MKTEADVELKVRVLNINYGHNRKLMEKCRMLKEYAEFVEVTRQYTAEGLDMQEALDTAIAYCVEHNILGDILKEYRSEVLGMLLEEFDQEKYERTIKDEGREEGREEGITRVNRLTNILLEQNRINDLQRAAKDTAFQEQLFREFHL